MPSRNHPRLVVYTLAVLAFTSTTFAAEVEYRVTFDATWSNATHSPFPPNPHFSGLIGGTHNSSLSVWDVGSNASEGIEVMAETGSKTPLRREVEDAIIAGTAHSLISGGGVGNSPGRVSTTFKADTSHPLVSLVSMIAPSPDWFVGARNLPLFEHGRWHGEIVVVLYAYDAGTDSGPNFTSANDDTNPAEPIHLIKGHPFAGDPPLGTFTFRLICNNPPAGDLNGDCRVDYLDLAVMARNWMVDHNLQPPTQP